MKKNVLVLNSSPRPKGNTDVLSNALLTGAEHAGHNARRITIRSLDIRQCTGCYQCTMKKGDPCIQKDDMKEVYNAVLQADVIVFASPLYWWQFNAPMKAVIDRLFAVAAANDMHMPPKETVLIIAAQGERDENFAQIIPYYQTCLVKKLQWTDRGMVLAGGNNQPGEVEKTPYVKEAEVLGTSLKEVSHIHI